MTELYLAIKLRPDNFQILFLLKWFSYLKIEKARNKMKACYLASITKTRLLQIRFLQLGEVSKEKA
jgi:hypothetical protein